MRFLSQINKRASRGFTLVEMLVVAPVVVLAIGGFIALMVTAVGDVMVTRDRNAMTYNIQNALDRIEQDTRLSNLFLTTTGTLSSPQGSNNNYTGTSAFTNTSSLILQANTTDKNPTDPTRQLIYYANQPNACGSSQTFNALLASKIIYFVYNGSLWRREVLPTWNTNATVDANTVCTAPWQRNTCSPGYVAALCQTTDTEILDDISSFTFNYYSDPASNAPLAAASAGSATTIEVTINGSKTTAGKTFTSSGVMRATMLN